MTTTSENPDFQPQGPGAYQTGVSTPPGEPTPPPAKSRNTIAIVALAAAIVGFIFAVWEGAYLLGWILLPIAFVLSLVALFQKNKPKKMAVTALIISIVGTIAGAVAFVSSAATAFDEAFTDETTISEPTNPEPGGDTAAQETDQPTDESAPVEETSKDPTSDQEAAQSGSRENPAALGSSVAGDDWEVTVNSLIPDATDQVLAENQFNDEPEEGFVYALANVTVKRLAPDSGYPMEVSIAWVTESGNVVTSTDAMAVVPDSLSDANELYEGAEATGNVALTIPAGDAGTIRVSPGLFADDVFFATS